jgi:hypothetical protein
MDSMPVDVRVDRMRGAASRLGGVPQRPRIGAGRVSRSRAAETARAVLVRIRILAALLVGITRIPPSIDVRQF